MNKTGKARRTFLKSTIGFGCLVASHDLLAGSDLPKLEASDPLAQSLAYSRKSDKPDQNCENCQVFQPDGGWGACPLFPGKSVKKSGWCKAWVPKS